MDKSFGDALSNKGLIDSNEFLIIMNLDITEKRKIIPIDAISWIMIRKCGTNEILYQEEVRFESETDQSSKENISLYIPQNRYFLNNYDIVLFTSAITKIQSYYEKYIKPSGQTSCIVLPDSDNASLLLSCFNRIGMRVPSFLFRIYILLNEFELYSKSTDVQYPVPISTNFVLHVCTNHDSSLYGLARCVDIKDALLSLLHKGHILSSSSLLLLCDEATAPLHLTRTSLNLNLNLNSNSRRHLSVDNGSLFPSTESSLFSPSFQPQRTFSEEKALYIPPPSISHFSNTPLLSSSSFNDSSRLSFDYLPEFQLPTLASSSLSSSLSQQTTRWNMNTDFSFHDEPYPPSSSWFGEQTSESQPLLSSSSPDSHGRIPSTSLESQTLLSSSTQTILSPSSQLDLEKKRSNSASFTPSSYHHTSSYPSSLLPPLSSYSSLPSSSLFSSNPSYDDLSYSSTPFDHSLTLNQPSHSILDSSRQSFDDSSYSSVSYQSSSFHKPSSSLNPHCPEFIPSSFHTPSSSIPSSKGPKQIVKRDLLEETMLMNRIEENHILTLKLRGLPYSATKEEIALFFSPLQIPRDNENQPTIVIGQDSSQRPSGEAFVTFATVEDCMEGLKYHLKHLGKRYIEIFPLFNKEYYRRNSIYCTICNKYGHTNESCVMRFQMTTTPHSSVL